MNPHSARELVYKSLDPALHAEVSRHAFIICNRIALVLTLRTEIKGFALKAVF